MITALIQMSLLIACGTIWKSYAPNHIAATAHRRALTDLVFYILLPALVLDIVWKAPLDSSSLHISVLASTGIAAGLVLMWFLLKVMKATKKQTGALLLAAAFPNATYLGLPVLSQVLGPSSREVVVQYDYFACTPILLSLGMLLAQHYGDNNKEIHPLKALAKIPPLWAVALGVTLNFLEIPQPDFIHSALQVLMGGVIPLMLIVLGMSIRWDSLRLNYLKLLLPVAAITLVCVPITVYLLSQFIGLNTDLVTPVTLLAAMPSMVFGIVICERYQLDTELYAAGVTFTTVLSLLTLPAWSHYLGIS